MFVSVNLSMWKVFVQQVLLIYYTLRENIFSTALWLVNVDPALLEQHYAVGFYIDPFNAKLKTLPDQNQSKHMTVLVCHVYLLSHDTSIENH